MDSNVRIVKKMLQKDARSAKWYGIAQENAKSPTGNSIKHFVL